MAAALNGRGQSPHPLTYYRKMWEQGRLVDYCTKVLEERAAQAEQVMQDTWVEALMHHEPTNDTYYPGKYRMSARDVARQVSRTAAY